LHELLPLLAPGRVDLRWGHGWQSETLINASSVRSVYVFRGHSEQTPTPVLFLYLPASHAVHGIPSALA
jgi:hypothetical protein